MNIDNLNLTNPAINTRLTPVIRHREIKNKKLYKVCEEFEAIFIKQMLNAMKKTINKSDFLHGGMAEDFFEDMLYDKYAEEMAETGNFGLARVLYDQLSNK